MNATDMEAVDDQSGMDLESMQTLYAKTLYALRESRKALLRQYAVAGEAELLEKIRSGEMREHPAYDHYLSVLIIEQTRLQVRAEMLAMAGVSAGAEAPQISVHLMLKERIEAHFANRLAEPPRMAQDALLLSFDTGLMMEVRYFSDSEYAIRWTWGDAELCIDTAPLHADLASFPNHVHRDDGTVTEDPLTRTGVESWSNFSGLLEALLVDPMADTPSAVRPVH